MVASIGQNNLHLLILQMVRGIFVFNSLYYITEKKMSKNSFFQFLSGKRKFSDTDSMRCILWCWNKQVIIPSINAINHIFTTLVPTLHGVKIIAQFQCSSTHTFLGPSIILKFLLIEPKSVAKW